MTLGELTEKAGVSVRTVRYYIGEGLLPPPEGAGPHSAYSRGHLARLRLIQRLKAHYLPLKEIRRRLAGLDDGEVRLLLAGGDDVPGPGGATEAPWEPSQVENRGYLDMMDAREPYRTEPLPLHVQTGVAPCVAPAPEPARGPEPARSQPPHPSGVFPARRLPGHEPSRTSQELWRRIPLGDEAELVISDRVYARHRDRIDWLVRWARKVFG